LPAGTHAHVLLGTWEVPPIFTWIQEQGEVEDDEMLRVFNLGVGMIAVVAATELGEILASLRASGQKGFVMGTVGKGGSGVVYDWRGGGEDLGD
jgi:phosphoribosylformylglycinamidine cyclo-ligase